MKKLKFDNHVEKADVMNTLTNMSVEIADVMKTLTNMFVERVLLNCSAVLAYRFHLCIHLGPSPESNLLMMLQRFLIRF